jgi:uncharacterized 2Fe-2S/4Fe-4S cluster protein (DUF4445 family)
MGDIVAYNTSSDDRLKNKIGNIPRALEKVKTLNGFTFKYNEIAGNLGFDTSNTYVGLSAQELSNVVPQIVKPIPFGNVVATGNNYMRVEYEKVVPLLVEAIKELAAEVNKLKISRS